MTATTGGGGAASKRKAPKASGAKRVKKKPGAKKATGNKSTTTRSPAKTAAAKKAAAKKAGNRPVSKKAPGKKLAGKKPTTTRTPAKKAAGGTATVGEKIANTVPVTDDSGVKDEATVGVAASPPRREAGSGPRSTASDTGPAQVDDTPAPGSRPPRDLWSDDWSDLDDAWKGGTGPGSEDARPRASAPDRTELFQNAMLELIDAARTALDTVEELVSDPNGIGTAFESLRDMAIDAIRGGVHSARSVVDPDDADDDFQSIHVDDV